MTAPTASPIRVSITSAMRSSMTRGRTARPSAPRSIIGLELGLPAEMVQRHPFPGPGLGVRILGEVTQAAADTLRLADHIFIEELRKAG